MFRTNWRQGERLTAKWARQVSEALQKLRSFRGAGGLAARGSDGGFSVSNQIQPSQPIWAKITDHGGTPSAVNPDNKYSFAEVIPNSNGGTPLVLGTHGGDYTQDSGWAYEVNDCTCVLVEDIVLLYPDGQGNWWFDYGPRAKTGIVALAAWSDTGGGTMNAFNYRGKKNALIALIPNTIPANVATDIVLSQSGWRLTTAPCSDNSQTCCKTGSSDTCLVTFTAIQNGSTVTGCDALNGSYTLNRTGSCTWTGTSQPLVIYDSQGNPIGQVDVSVNVLVGTQSISANWTTGGLPAYELTGLNDGVNCIDGSYTLAAAGVSQWCNFNGSCTVQF